MWRTLFYPLFSVSFFSILCLGAARYATELGMHVDPSLLGGTLLVGGIVIAVAGSAFGYDASVKALDMRKDHESWDRAEESKRLEFERNQKAEREKREWEWKVKLEHQIGIPDPDEAGGVIKTIGKAKQGA